MSIIGYPVAYVLPSLTGLFYLTYCTILCSLETLDWQPAYIPGCISECDGDIMDV